MARMGVGGMGYGMGVIGAMLPLVAIGALTIGAYFLLANRRRWGFGSLFGPTTMAPMSSFTSGEV